MGPGLVTAVDAALALLVPPGTPVVVVPGTGSAARTAVPQVSSGDQLVLLTDRRLGARRLRHLAREAGLVVDRELVVLPNLRAAAFVVEDAVESMSWFWNAFATVPPGLSRGSLIVSALTRAGRPRPVVRWVGRLVPGRMVIGHRP
ncbi:hypothetical protein [Terracoccus sp. 273MFTsu3.1]|uniref:hypothetical protein n=1 Tax=Terracoccus sp. 273MFTsu3.1 TaxID=1172188 RepID=UPI000375DB0D|nr:hypothetical protein [Terracoccus sp. 273MFTsu3.1]